MEKYKFAYIVEVSAELLTDDKELVRQIENENGTKVTYDSLEDSMRDTIVECLEDLSSSMDIAVQPVKHGRWIAHGSLPTKQWSCSECKGLVEVSHYCNKCYYDFCPNCGAKMDGGDTYDKPT